MRRDEIIASILNALKPLKLPLYEWRVTPAEFNELPLITVRDKEENIDESEEGSSVKHNLKTEIEYTAAGENLSAKDIREAIASILNALKQEDKKNKTAWDEIRIKSIEIDFEHYENIIGRGFIELEAAYHTEKWGL